MLFLCFWLCVFVYVNGRRQTGRLDVAENIQSPPRAECLSLNHAGSETYSRQVNPPELDFIFTHPLYTAPWLLHSLAASPSPSQPLTHTFPPPPILSSRSMIDHVLCSCSFSPPFVPAQIINASIPQTVHIHFLQQTSLCGVTEWILVQLHVWHKACYFSSSFTSILYDLTHPAVMMKALKILN